MIGTTQPMWTLEQGAQFVRGIHSIAFAAGYNLTIGGGVLMDGYSDHDLDVVAIPRVQVPQPDQAGLIRLLSGIPGLEFGGRIKCMAGRVSLGYNLGERRVDLIVLYKG